MSNMKRLEPVFDEVYHMISAAVEEAYSTRVDDPYEYEDGCGYEEMTLPSLSRNELELLDATLSDAGVDFWLDDEARICEGENYVLWISAHLCAFGGDPHITWGLRRRDRKG